MKKGTLTYITLTIIGLAIFIVALTKLMNGQTITKGQSHETLRSESLICESKSAYPFFSYDSPKDRKMRIVAEFYNNNINAISLTYELYYDDVQQITASETNNHASMNIFFGKNKLKADAYNANYAKLEDRMRMTLYATKNDINSTMAQFFLISTSDNASIPENLTEYQENYEMQGFACETNNN